MADGRTTSANARPLRTAQAGHLVQKEKSWQKNISLTARRKIRHGVEAKWVGRQGVPAQRIAAKYATPVMAIITHIAAAPTCLFGRSDGEAVSGGHVRAASSIAQPGWTPAVTACSAPAWHTCAPGSGPWIQGRVLEAAVDEVIARNADLRAPLRQPAETGTYHVHTYIGTYYVCAYITYKPCRYCVVAPKGAASRDSSYR